MHSRFAPTHTWQWPQCTKSRASTPEDSRWPAASADDGLSAWAMFPQTSEWLYELAFREADGIEVTLLWDGAEDRALLNVRDRRTGEWFVSGVDRADGLEA